MLVCAIVHTYIHTYIISLNLMFILGVDWQRDIIKQGPVDGRPWILQTIKVS